MRDPEQIRPCFCTLTIQVRDSQAHVSADDPAGAKSSVIRSRALWSPGAKGGHAERSSVAGRNRRWTSSGPTHLLFPRPIVRVGSRSTRREINGEGGMRWAAGDVSAADPLTHFECDRLDFLASCDSP